jgi:hypothetical protein
VKVCLKTGRTLTSAAWLSTSEPRTDLRGNNANLLKDGIMNCERTEFALNVAREVVPHFHETAWWEMGDMLDSAHEPDRLAAIFMAVVMVVDNAHRARVDRNGACAARKRCVVEVVFDGPEDVEGAILGHQQLMTGRAEMLDARNEIRVSSETRIHRGQSGLKPSQIVVGAAVHDVDIERRDLGPLHGGGESSHEHEVNLGVGQCPQNFQEVDHPVLGPSRLGRSPGPTR